MNKRTLIKYFSYGLAVLAFTILLKAHYMTGKAWLAQVLIQTSWKQSLSDKKAIKPWPWADTFAVAEMQFLHHSLIVLEGESLRNLAFGPARMSASAKFSQLGNVVIYGHRDTHFASLQELKIGDHIRVNSKKGNQVYQVNKITIVDETDVRPIQQSDKQELTLITCYPFEGVVANASQRFVVKAFALNS